MFNVMFHEINGQTFRFVDSKENTCNGKRAKTKWGLIANPLRIGYAWFGQKLATLAPLAFCQTILQSTQGFTKTSTRPSPPVWSGTPHPYLHKRSVPNPISTWVRSMTIEHIAVGIDLIGVHSLIEIHTCGRPIIIRVPELVNR